MDRIPRGLKLAKPCTWLEDNLRSERLDKMTDCYKLLLKLISQRQRYLEKICTDLKEIQEKLATFSDIESFDN